MKVSGNDSNKRNVQEINDQTAERLRRKKEEAAQAAISGDTVNVGTAAAIRDGVSVDKVLAERQARVADIKARVAAGTYQIPASEVLAESVARGIVDELEILKAGGE